MDLTAKLRRQLQGQRRKAINATNLDNRKYTTFLKKKGQVRKKGKHSNFLIFRHWKYVNMLYS